MKTKLQSNPIIDLKGELLKTKNNEFDFTIPNDTEVKQEEIQTTKEEKIILEEEVKQEKKEVKTEETPTEKKTEKTKDNKKPRTYRFTPQLIEDIEKIVYMDRELRGNETTLVTKAIESYVYSKEGKEFIRQYNELKGINNNGK